MIFKKEPVRMTEIAKQVVKNLRDQAKSKELTLSFEDGKSRIPPVLIDRDKTTEVLSNLVDNAIKYTPKGNASVEVSHQNGEIITSVKDTGVGLTQEEIAHLFEKFTRGRSKVSKAIKGTGLGLYIARKMIEAQGGRIWAESEGKDKGSTFSYGFKIHM